MKEDRPHGLFFSAFFLLGAACFGVAVPAPLQATPRLIVFADSASMLALDELVRLYQRKTGLRVDVTDGGSGAVLMQFSREHYGDVYIPGSDDFMDRAVAQGAVLPHTRTVLVYLLPVIEVARGSPKQVRGLADLTRRDLHVVIGEPRSACLGQIAKTILEREKRWPKVLPRIVSFAPSCENVLRMLLLGEADVIIGWDFYTRQHPDKVTAIPLPWACQKPRHIPAAIIRWSRQPAAAKAFIAFFLAAPEMKPIWRKHKYTIKQTWGNERVAMSCAPSPRPGAKK